MKIIETILPVIIKQGINLCQKELELDQLPNIELVDRLENNSFGEFNGSVRVAVKNRHPIDIVRTLCHELVHWKQRTMNMPLDGADGSEIENQANAIAGVILRKFGKMYPQYFMDTLPN